MQSIYTRIYEKLDQKRRLEWDRLCVEIIRLQIVAIEREKLQNLFATMVANLSKLSAEDLRLVEAQQCCPIHERGEPPVSLGARGVPVKITIKGQVVFLCCRDHIKKAQANPDKTLAEVKEVKKMGTVTLEQLKAKLKQMSE